MLYVDNTRLSMKSHFKAGILLIFGGYIGLHRFYVEREKSGIVMALLFVGALLGLLIHPIISGVLCGINLLMLGVDGFAIITNGFEDGYGKTLSPENAVKDSEPLFGMLFSFAFVPVFCAIAIFDMKIYIIAAFFALISFIYLIKELKWISK